MTSKDQSEQTRHATIGVDISKAKIDCHRIPDGTTKQFTNSKAGHKAFIKWAGSAAEEKTPP